jgi:hypothetical protein
MIGRDEHSDVRDPLLEQLERHGWRALREVTAYQPSISRGRHLRVRVDIWAARANLVIAVECKHVLRQLDELRTATRQAQGYMAAFDWQFAGERLPRPQIAFVATEHTLSGAYIDQEGGQGPGPAGVVWSPLLYAQYFTLQRELWDYGASFLMGPSLHWLDKTGKRRMLEREAA